jgi:hypothetical protein
MFLVERYRWNNRRATLLLASSGKAEQELEFDTKQVTSLNTDMGLILMPSQAALSLETDWLEQLPSDFSGPRGG